VATAVQRVSNNVELAEYLATIEVKSIVIINWTVIHHSHGINLS